MEDLTLHQYHNSGNCYKIRLAAALLNIEITLEDYDLVKGESRTPEFLSKVSSNGSVPVLQIGNTFLPESGAALNYIAAGSHLVPKDRLQYAEMLRWMFFEQYQIEPTVGSLRFWTRKLGLENLDEAKKGQVNAKRQAGSAALDVMEQHLSGRRFFVREKFSLADVALFGYTHVSEQGDFDLSKWPNVKAWCERVKEQPGYVPIGNENWS
ncbi:hypothetical protein DOTSEDRAFT_72665 [Dothistroma septosporum NZE10]|uniref:Glutathione S-transferase n=1 Tax=Dothistroma septosporum (strain NZE10 / CBS 128990) TaxID=675120 RepID=M2YN04_DOTSN|nr:hypothetical protein DOTSEDRAFT_72665 [Dothistroma septosporum NZE10]